MTRADLPIDPTDAYFTIVCRLAKAWSARIGATRTRETVTKSSVRCSVSRRNWREDEIGAIHDREFHGSRGNPTGKQGANSPQRWAFVLLRGRRVWHKFDYQQPPTIFLPLFDVSPLLYICLFYRLNASSLHLISRARRVSCLQYVRTSNLYYNLDV